MTSLQPSDYSDFGPDGLNMVGWLACHSCNQHAVSFSHFTLPCGSYNSGSLSGGCTWLLGVFMKVDLLDYHSPFTSFP